MTAPGKNVFDLSHDVKMSCKMGNLYPTMAMEVVPGDSFSIGCESLMRFAPLIAPVMHRIDVTMHYFFVPNRILWPEWEKWIFNELPAGTMAPYISLDSFTNAQQQIFADYMGVPPITDPSASCEISALPFAAYQKIYNEYYRDQNLVADVTTDLSDGDNNSAKSVLLALRTRAWEHDYFTAALPFAQKGDAVDIPLGTISYDPLAAPGVAQQYKQVIGGANAAGGAAAFHITNGSLIDTSAAAVNLDPNGTLVVGATTINDLRRAFRLQEWLEKNARGGTRYNEGILSHFGVRSEDYRLQRPEYITGTKSPVIISEVLQTSETVDGASPQGNMAGHGVSVTTGQYGKYYAKEHGYIIGIMSVMPKPAYQQGVNRHFLKFTDPLSYYWPSFANIGEQGVANRELYIDSLDPEGVFGYVPRYAEYKFMPNRVAGEFRTTLAYWHLGRIFDSAPALNQAFIECVPRTDIFGVTDPETVDNLYVHIFHKIKAVRPMPKYGNPSF